MGDRPGGRALTSAAPESLSSRGRSRSPQGAVAPALLLTIVSALSPAAMERVAAATATPSATAKAASPSNPLPNLRALAPYELLARGQRAPAGVAVSPAGRVYFTDEKAGALFEVATAGAYASRKRCIRISCFGAPIATSTRCGRASRTRCSAAAVSPSFGDADSIGASHPTMLTP